MEQNINRSTTKTSKKKTPRVNHNKSPHAMAIQNNHHHMQEQKTPGTQSMPGTRPLEATQRGKRKEKEEGETFRYPGEVPQEQPGP